MFLLLIIYGCSSSGGPAALPVSTFQGSIHLFSNQLNNQMNSLDTVHQNVTVFIPTLGIATVSDTFGHWLLNNIPSGTYDVYATSKGYDTLILWGMVSSGNTTHVPIGGLFPNPTRTLTIRSVEWTANTPNVWPIVVTGSTQGGLMNESIEGFICFFDTIPGIPAKGSHFAEIDGWPASDSTWRAWSADFYLDTTKFRSGMKLYVTACVSSPSGINLEQGEEDPTTFNPHDGQMQVISPGPLSAPYVTTYPW